MTATAGRLSKIAAAFVVARRDFTAILFRRTFIFFLLGPLFPVVVMALAGAVGQRVEGNATPQQIGVAMPAADADALLAASERLSAQFGPAVPRMTVLDQGSGEDRFDARAVLQNEESDIAAVLTGSAARPVLTATAERLERWRGPVAAVAAEAARTTPTAFPRVDTVEIAASAASDRRARLITAQAGQVLLFLLIMMLASMVLSNLVEEKGNKIIEILAAAVPMDAVFLGKLFAMLGISLVGVAVWGSTAGAILLLAGPGAISLPMPGVGWPMFVALGVTYFAMGYLLLGSVFLAIGSLANSVREVQTLSMPVTMVQVLLFFFASLAVSELGKPIEWAAMAFPLSSPFAMLSRAAQDEALWPHLLAIVWQAVCVAVFIRLGAALFRARVMKSGPQAATPRRGFPFRRKAPFIAGSEKSA
jgi:ABC-2 type transport system permease protein